MKCIHCQQDVIYAGLPSANFGHYVELQDQHAPFGAHRCHAVQGGLTLMQEKFIVPMYDGGLILCIDVCVN